MSNRDLSKSFKNFCPRCKYFQQETGVCKKYFINSRDYPIEFLNNCAGDYFKEAPQISEQTDVSDALEESKAFKGDGSRVSEMHLKEEMFYNPIFRELPRPERVFLVLYIISLPFIFLFTFLFFLAIVGGDFFDSQGTLITYRILAILLLSIWIYGLWWKFIRHPGKISNRYKNLLNQLKSNNVQTRREAAQKLGQLYPSLVSKLYILAMLGLNEEHNTLRRDAANSLGSFSNDAIVEALNNVSSNDDVEVSEAAKNAITCIKIQAQNELMPLIFPEFIENRREKLQDLIIASFNKLIRSTSNSKEGQEFISNILVPLLSHEDFFDKHFFNFKKCIKGVHNFL